LRRLWNHQLSIELDFCNEGRNSEKAAVAIEEADLNCVVPKVVWKHSSERVLCMEFEEGFKATDVDAINKAGLKKWYDVFAMI
jgi:predicted unusual protein kinase regulating ubiquinone biosynthesis (AarF/ABC1/UbiB family)